MTQVNPFGGANETAQRLAKAAANPVLEQVGGSSNLPKSAAKPNFFKANRNQISQFLGEAASAVFGPAQDNPFAQLGAVSARIAKERTFSEATEKILSGADFSEVDTRGLDAQQIFGLQKFQQDKFAAEQKQLNDTFKNLETAQNMFLQGQLTEVELVAMKNRILRGDAESKANVELTQAQTEQTLAQTESIEMATYLQSKLDVPEGFAIALVNRAADIEIASQRFEQAGKELKQGQMDQVVRLTGIILASQETDDLSGLPPLLGDQYQAFIEGGPGAALGPEGIKALTPQEAMALAYEFVTGEKAPDSVRAKDVEKAPSDDVAEEEIAGFAGDAAAQADAAEGKERQTAVDNQMAEMQAKIEELNKRIAELTGSTPSTASTVGIQGGRLYRAFENFDLSNALGTKARSGRAVFK